MLCPPGRVAVYEVGDWALKGGGAMEVKADPLEVDRTAAMEEGANSIRDCSPFHPVREEARLMLDWLATIAAGTPLEE